MRPPWPVCGALSAEQVQRGAQAPAGLPMPQVETTPVLDGMLVTDTAETAYKARRQPRVPLLLGSNSADTAGNSIKPRRRSSSSRDSVRGVRRPRRRTTPMVRRSRRRWWRARNDDFGQAEPARFAANAFAANGSPVYLYRLAYAQAAMREQMRNGAPRTTGPD
jgi:para-nitrobenzyl esterase